MTIDLASLALIHRENAIQNLTLIDLHLDLVRTGRKIDATRPLERLRGMIDLLLVRGDIDQNGNQTIGQKGKEITAQNENQNTAQSLRNLKSGRNANLLQQVDLRIFLRPYSKIKRPSKKEGRPY